MAKRPAHPLTSVRVTSTLEKLKFVWDPDKALANPGVHDGVTFDLARRAFLDPMQIEFEDDREDYGERRYIVLGAIDGVVHHVTYTPRGGRIRIISARRAERHEANRYYKENSF